MRSLLKPPRILSFILVILALSTAARAGELLGLTWSDVDLGECRIFLRNTKNAQPRTAWVFGEAPRLLNQHAKMRRPHDDRVFVSVRGKRYDYSPAFEAAVCAAGVRDFRFYDLRHSAATYLARDGASEQELRHIGGWKSNVVNRYVHIAAEDTKSVLQKLNDRMFGK